MDTGEELALFLAQFLAGKDVGQGGRPRAYSDFSSLNMATGDYTGSQALINGTLNVEGTGAEAVEGGEFAFEMSMNSDSGEEGIALGYSQVNESWSWGAFQKGVLDIQMTGNVYSPGYIAATPTGIENEGLSPNASSSYFNPETMRGISYYYFAPNMVLEGTVQTGTGAPRRVQGLAWFEHQWGNYNNLPGLYATNYVWLYARLDSGDMLTLRQWARPGFQFDTSLNRYVYLRKLGDGEGYEPLYAFGSAAQYIPLGSTPSPGGTPFPINATLETPQGTWYIAPDYPNQFSRPYLYEGAAYLRTESLEGPIVGRLFVELIDTPDTAEPGAPRGITGGLPDAPTLD